jgi:hypothetical protein
VVREAALTENAQILSREVVGILEVESMSGERVPQKALTAAQWLLGMHKLMSAMKHLDVQQHETLRLDDYSACDEMLRLLPPIVSREFQLDRAWSHELPEEAIEYLDNQGQQLQSQLANLRERAEHE